MATYWTLATGGVEKTLSDWGIGMDWGVSVANGRVGTATLRTKERFDAGAAQWSFMAHATIYRDRVSTTGAANSFSGGTIFFQGYFDDPQRLVQGGRENVVYKLNSVWWLFQRNYLKQQRNIFNGWSTTLQRVSQVYVSDPGAGYAVGDVLTIAGTPGGGTACQVTVAAINATGGVTVAVVTNGGGSWSVAGTPPTTPNSPTGGTGGHTQCKIGLVFGAVPNVVSKLSSEIYLGQGFNQALLYTYQQTIGQTCAEICGWINECYNPTKRGATSGRDDGQDVLTVGLMEPNANLPITEVKSLFCEDAMMAALRLCPDAVIYEDPTTSPPTLNVRQLAKWNNGTTPPSFVDYTNLPQVALTITAEQEKEISSQSQLARVVPGVIIYYKFVNVVDGVASLQIVADVYPGTVTEWTPEVVAQTFDMAGSQTKHVSATVSTASLAQLVGSSTDQKNWWLTHDKTLQDSMVDAATIAVVGGPTIVDDSGAAVTLPGSPVLYELLGTIPTWVNAATQRVHVSQKISFYRWADSNHVVPDTKQESRVHTQTIHVTTAAMGSYWAVESFTAGEVLPQNVAQSVYRSASATQFSGRITFVGSALRSDITLGTRLKLIGPNTTFQDCLVQSIEMSPCRGEMTVTFGPCSPLSISMWVEMARASRLRLSWNMPTRGDGGVSGAGTVDLGASAGANNTTHGVGGNSIQGVFFPR